MLRRIRCQTDKSPLLIAQQIEAVPALMGNKRMLYGTIVGGKSSDGYDVQYDILPLGNNIVPTISNGKGNLVALRPGEEEVAWTDPGMSPFEAQEAALLLRQADSLPGVLPGAVEGTMVNGEDGDDSDSVTIDLTGTVQHPHAGPAAAGPPPPPLPPAAPPVHCRCTEA